MTKPTQRNSYTERRDAARIAAELDPVFLQCRDTRHRWDARYAKEISEGGGFFRILVCERCGAERHEEFSHAMELVNVTMKLPKGYSIAGLGPITAAHRAGIRQVALEKTWRLGS